ncbi:MAG: hypothetical protein ABF636_10205, partial [Acetobacter sp.]
RFLFFGRNFARHASICVDQRGFYWQTRSHVNTELGPVPPIGCIAAVWRGNPCKKATLGGGASP